MKNKLILIAALCGMAALTGCNNREEVRQLSALAPDVNAMQQSYRGVLPCADCEGIEETLFLERDGTWIMSERYLDERAPEPEVTWGTWARTAETLTLTAADGNKRYFRPKGNDLEMLDYQGNPITSEFDYALKATEVDLPTTPMPMKGMYMPGAGAAIFTDCGTGRQLRVANSNRLERGYAQARGNNETKPVLLVIKGHFARSGNGASGVQQKMLVVDDSGMFAPGKNCND